MTAHAARFESAQRAVLVGVLAIVLGCSTATSAGSPPPTTVAAGGESLLRTTGQAQGAFFARLTALCGKRFPGRAVFTSTPDDPMARASLVMHVATCTSEQIRVPFIVDGDRSRTWVVTLHPGAMQLKHDHRHADGTPDEITMYGGWAAPGTNPFRQRFPADSQTKVLIPAASTNVWTLELDDRKGEFVYDLERDGRPRFRAVFDLRSPLPGEP